MDPLCFHICSQNLCTTFTPRFVETALNSHYTEECSAADQEGVAGKPRTTTPMHLALLRDANQRISSRGLRFSLPSYVECPRTGLPHIGGSAAALSFPWPPSRCHDEAPPLPTLPTFHIWKRLAKVAASWKSCEKAEALFSSPSS